MPTSITPRNQTNAADLMRVQEALFGRVAVNVGPTNPRWSTFSGDMTPEAIVSALEQANAGMPFQFCDMSRRAIENDAAIGAATELAFSSIVSEEDRIEPPQTMKRDPLAIANAAFLKAVREQVEDFDRARFSLLWAEGVGYASAENIYAYRPITWYLPAELSRKGKQQRITRTYCVPVKLEIVDGRSFRFDTHSDEPLLWLQGDYVSLPPAKFIWHEAYGVSSIRERRGFMRSCLFMHAIKQWAWRDMAEYLHMYGLPQMVAEYDAKQYNYPEAKELARTVMDAMGQGGVPTVPMGAFALRTDTPPPQWALVHRDAANAMNEEIFRRISLGLLTMTESGGSYGLGDIHAESAFMGKRLRANNLCRSIRRWLWAPTMALNTIRLAEDLGRSPAEIMCALPDYHARLLRDDTPENRQKIYTQAMKDGVQCSATQYRSDLHLDEPKDDDDVLKGEAQSIPSSGALAGATDASEGVKAPPDPNKVATGSVSADGKQQSSGASTKLQLTSTDIGAIVTVNQTLASVGLPPKTSADGSHDPDGELSVAEFKAKHATIISDAADAEVGTENDSNGDAAAPPAKEKA